MGNRLFGISGVLLFVGGLGLSFAIPDVDTVMFVSPVLVMTIGAGLLFLTLRRSWRRLGPLTQRLTVIATVVQMVIATVVGWNIKEPNIYIPLLLVALLSAAAWGAMCMWPYKPLPSDQHSAKR